MCHRRHQKCWRVQTCSARSRRVEKQILTADNPICLMSTVVMQSKDKKEKDQKTKSPLSMNATAAGRANAAADPAIVATKNAYPDMVPWQEPYWYYGGVHSPYYTASS